MFIGVAGVAMMRASARAAAEHSDRVDAEFTTLTDSLEKLAARLAELRRRQEQMTPEQIVQFIDDQCAEPFADFADSRNALIQRFGLPGFASVMTQFASAERFVNRAWSAAADGYVEEVKASLDRADGHLRLAHGLLDELSRNTAV